MIRIVAVIAGVLTHLASTMASAADIEASEPFLPEEAARSMVVPEGFHVSLFAGEPDVRQPISFCIDDSGRLWVAEAYNYPFRDKEPQDRVLILEDTDGDGKSDKRTVFYDKLGYVTGIEVGFGGVWIMSPPELLFIPDKDGDDRPDGPPQVLLDGFGNTTSAHNIANGFTWGPDGWLYAGHGRTSPSDVGPPGTPDDQRIHHDGGVYRYHPTRHVFETFCDGTTNPWGVAFDEYGQAIISNCVNPHLFHAIQGGHYEPWRNRPSSQYAFERLPTIADHLHWKGDMRKGGEELLAAGGGHAHCGTMVYFGDNWPDRYRGTVFLGNVHGRRINNDTLVRQGSSYTASHRPDLMIAKDPWFKAVTIQCGPDGAVFVSDWSDTGECHDYRNTHRETGRMFKIAYGEVKPVNVDVASLSNEKLIELQLHKNDWHVTHARRVLQERAAAGDEMCDVHAALLTIFRENEDVTRKLRAMWALYVTDGADEEFVSDQLRHDSEYIRAWAVRLLSEPAEVSPATLELFTDLAAVDPSPFVRLHLASAVIRLSTAQRWPIVEQLVMRGEDADDPFLPLMVWYGLEPLVIDDTPRALRIVETTRLAKLRPFIVRRAASGEGASERVAHLAEFLAADHDAATQRDVLDGMFAALRGRRDMQTPASWPMACETIAKSSDEQIGRLVLRVGLLLNDPAAAAALRLVARDEKAPASDRKTALEDLLEQKDSDLPPLLFQLLDEDDYCTVALRGLARFDHPDTPAEILKRYAALSYEDKQAALGTLASRPCFAVALLEAVQTEQLARSDLTAANVRQLQQLDDELLQEQVTAIWGIVGEISKNATAAINRYKQKLKPDALAKANAAHGRAIFAKSCAACHRLFGEGGQVGPEITGANRSSLDYLLENILQPSALVPRDYQMTVVVTTDGRVVSGLVVEETDAVVKLQTQTEVVIVPVEEIDTRKLTPVSMMPEGLLKPLKDAEVRDLIAYLGSPEQVALEESSKVDMRVDDDRLIITAGGQPLATYVFRDEKITRPYFTDVYAGKFKLTRNHPPAKGDAADHALLHPGIWLSFGDISGHDYWRLRAKTEHVEFVQKPQRKGGEGQFAVRNRYLSTDGKQTVCEEVARYRFVPLAESPGVLLLWDSTFSSDDGAFAFGDQEEMGLGVRVATPLAVHSKQGGRILNSHGQTNEREVWGRAAAWCDYGGKLDGRQVGMTLLPHPDNFRPSWFHARDYGLLEANPFGRQAFRAGARSEIEVPRGESLRLRFGVFLYNVDEKTPVDVDAVLAAYLKQAGGTPK